MKLKLLHIIIFTLISNSIFSQKQTNVYATIDVDSSYSLIQANYLNPDFIILDVRTIGEYNSKHIENGVELDYNMSGFSDVLDTLIKDKIYLVHCLSGGRSTNTFNLMQTMGFTDVYNMSGGLGAWETAGYSVTTMVNPIMLSVSDTLVEFIDISIIEDTVSIKITNYGNDTLKFTGITDLTSTEFSTDFDTNNTLTGLMDYEFNIFYTPTDNINDSIIFSIYSNVDTISYFIRGNTLNTLVRENTDIAINMYPNPTGGIFTIENNSEISEIEIFNSNGELVNKITELSHKHKINLSENLNGLYFIRIKTNDKIITKKLLLYK